MTEDVGVILFVTIFYIIPSIVTALIFKNKNRSTIWGAILGIFLSYIGLIISLFLKNKLAIVKPADTFPENIPTSIKFNDKPKAVFENIAVKKEANKADSTNNPICPYCNKSLDRIIKRKTKCQFCNKDIYVRTTQNIFPSKLLTHENSEVVDILKSIAFLGVTEAQFIKCRRELSEKTGKDTSDMDVIGYLFDNLISKTKDTQKLKMIYYNMALALNRQGKDCFVALQNSQRMELMEYKKNSNIIKSVRIDSSSEKSCHACHELDNKVYTIEEALEKMPIPHKECSNILFGDKKGFCMCIYKAVLYDFKSVMNK